MTQFEKVTAYKCPVCGALLADEKAVNEHREHCETGDTVTFFRFVLRYERCNPRKIDVHIDRCQGTRSGAARMCLMEPVVEEFSDHVTVSLYDYKNTRSYLNGAIKELGRKALAAHAVSKAGRMAACPMNVDSQSDWPEDDEDTKGKTNG